MERRKKTFRIPYLFAMANRAYIVFDVKNNMHTKMQVIVEPKMQRTRNDESGVFAALDMRCEYEMLYCHCSYYMFAFTLALRVCCNNKHLTCCMIMIAWLSECNRI